MRHDPLLSDDLPMLLRAFPSGALEAVVGVCKQNESWSPLPAERAEKAHRLAPGADFTPHADDIAREILWWGSHDFWRVIGRRPDWRNLVSGVAERIGADTGQLGADHPVWAIEQAVLRKAFEKWDALSPAQREAALKEPGADKGAAPGGLLAAAGSVFALGGEQILAQIALRGAAAAVAGPFAAVAAVAGGGWAAYSLAGPSHRVLRPVVLHIALTRQQLRLARAAAAFEE